MVYANQTKCSAKPNKMSLTFIPKRNDLLVSVYSQFSCLVKHSTDTHAGIEERRIESSSTAPSLSFLFLIAICCHLMGIVLKKKKGFMPRK